MNKWLRFLGLFLAACAAILMVISFAMPWWMGDFTSADPGVNAIRIYGWGLRHSLIKLGQSIEQDATPLYQTILAWCYLSVSIAALFLSLRLRRLLSFLLSAVSGLGYAAYALVSVYIVIQNRLYVQGLSLEGKSFVPVEFVLLEIDTSIQPGFYLALATGAFIVLTALLLFILRDIGKKQ